MSKRTWTQIAAVFTLKEIVVAYSDYLVHGNEQRMSAIPAHLIKGNKNGNAPAPVGDESTANNLYEHEALPDVSDGLCIRLLELLPAGNSSDEVLCRLTQHRAAECRGEYETLSYVWGDMSQLVPINIGGKFFDVSQNLYQALVDLRQEDKPRVLWVDAICIDQGKIEERNQQVSAMGQIYRAAKRVVIHLGAAFPKTTKKAYDLIERCASESLRIGYTLKEPITLSTLSQGSQIKHGLTEDEIVALDPSSLRHLGEAPWWARAWTAQEVLLAKDALVVTGSHSMSWDRFCAGVDFGLDADIIDVVVAGTMIDGIIKPYLAMHTLRMELSKPIDPAAQDERHSAQRLLALLIYCRSRSATNPRDKVYAFLGLKDIGCSVPNTLGIQPDYAAEVADVYRNASQQIMTRSRSLDILGACLPASSISMPTWVPDWSDTGPAPRPLMFDTFGRRRTTHASLIEAPAATFADDNRTLILSGLPVTTITTVSPVLDRLILEEDELWVSKLGQSFLARLVRIVLLVPLMTLVFYGLYKRMLLIVKHIGVFADMEAFARDVQPTNPVTPPPMTAAAQDSRASMDRRGEVEKEAEREKEDSLYETRELFYAWRANLAPMFRLHERGVDRWLPGITLYSYLRTTWTDFSVFTRYLETAYDRRLAQGANGHLLLVPGHAQAGDQVVLVKEGRVPLVLRPGVGDEKGYTVVGEAYVEGIMNGEAFRERDCAEIRVR
ncbi:HET-domain-containing protein [Apiospora saccharicola]